MLVKGSEHCSVLTNENCIQVIRYSVSILLRFIYGHISSTSRYASGGSYFQRI